MPVGIATSPEHRHTPDLPSEKPLSTMIDIVADTNDTTGNYQPLQDNGAKVMADEIDIDEELENSESEDMDEEADLGPKKPKISHRRREQNKKFAAWLSERTEKETKEEVKAAVLNADDEALSIRNLMSKQESNVIIRNPRDYQMELFERAKQQNVIAVLDTGSGKTLIAVLLLQYIIDQELEDRAMGKKPRISFFLVDCVTLVFQQFAVLECNLDEKIERFCGEMGCDLWDKRIWEKHFKENMVIVCTAEILYQCLMHSFVTLDQINLLIFDEAHHAKKNHAYARIIKDFYVPEIDSVKRPKIFGMTASPVDARRDPVEAAQELEAMLHCQIATTADLSLLRMAISRPEENIASYSRLQPPHVTPLCAKLKSAFGGLQAVKKVAAFASEATSELGEWCADRVWGLALTDEETRKIERTTERLFLAEKDARPIEQLNADMDRIRQAHELANNWALPHPLEISNGISPKVLLLKQYLDRVYEKPCDNKCIIFVKKRYTARLLGELLSELHVPHLRHGILIGTRYGDAGDVKISFRQQVLTLMRFRKGEINCLIATSIAEEGLDIPDCNLIIRFDLYDTLIQYIQSRGRARHANSRYIHMIEAGNKLHLQNIHDVREGELVMRRFCSALPADRLLLGSDHDLDAALAKEKSMRRYTDPKTGATLTYNSSLVVLAHFAGCLPNHDNLALRPEFFTTFENQHYISEVQLPEGSPIRSAIGRPSSRKALAKRSAAFELCILLREGNYLDSNLIPTIKKYLPAMRNAHLALNMNKGNNYELKMKPSVWSRSRGISPRKLYLTVLNLESPEDPGHPYQPLALLTRTPMPAEIPAISLYLQADRQSHMQCTSIKEPFETTDLIMEKLNAFTLRIYKDVFNKTFEVNIPEMDYWFAPILNNQRVDRYGPLPMALFDWQCIEHVYQHGGNLDERTKCQQWKRETPDSELKNRFLVDPMDGERRFSTIGVHQGLNLHSAVPQDAFPDKYMASIIEYSNHRFAKWRKSYIENADPEQPVVHGKIMRHRPNWHVNYTEKERKKTVNTNCYVCPEPLILSTLPLPIASMSYLLGIALSRIESHLIALEACDVLGLTMRSDLALEAMTKDSDNTEEHDREQINVQRGMGKNYERLEFIGDSFLKMATSISIFSKCPHNDEFEYHVRRMEMICNKNLFGVALKLKLYEYVRSRGYSRRTWYPEGVKLLEGKGAQKSEDPLRLPKPAMHHLGDKTVADVCEALIGAALLSYRDTNNMDMAVKAVSALVAREDHDVSSWAEYYPLYTKPAWQTAEASASQISLAVKVEKEHAYSFRWPRLLRSAFIHPSYSFLFEKVPCYQRLEFLGDALLDMVCIEFLFHKHPDRDPQWLTEHKMAMVSNKFLAALAVKLGFHRHFRVAGSAVEIQTREFLAEIDEAQSESAGAMDYWTLTKNSPKGLSDIVEAYIGALFVDSEFNYGEVERFFKEHVQEFFEDMSIYDTFANNHPTTYLYKKLTHSFGCMNYRLMANEIESYDGVPPRNVAVVMIHDEVIAHGAASSSKNAKVKASQAALEALASITTAAEYRMQYGCRCEKKMIMEGEIPNEEIGSAI